MEDLITKITNATVRMWIVSLEPGTAEHVHPAEWTNLYKIIESALGQVTDAQRKMDARIALTTPLDRSGMSEDTNPLSVLSHQIADAILEQEVEA